MSYIVPRDKPQECMKCPYINQYNDCRLIWRSERIRTVEEQYRRCPLIEVPTPHGRLGDLDALVKTLEQNRLCYVSDIDDESFELGTNRAIDVVRNANTVIKAEE